MAAASWLALAGPPSEAGAFSLPPVRQFNFRCCVSLHPQALSDLPRLRTEMHFDTVYRLSRCS